MFVDYHVHTYLCKHASGRPEEYVKAAIRSGISEIGFSDH
ncbi:MAG TPA: histidinol phosphate phosphatase, partial [Lentisphaeria bacterium]|nr:histidinol phosphate phosphatase [Lentisphaeria bacterium]